MCYCISQFIDRSVINLRGGERQKVALARALVFDPDILLLDEPVSAIDENSRDAVCKELRRIQKELGITVLHVSHNQHETDLVADTVAVLENGAIVKEYGNENTR